jgi:hypothetical protein
MRRRLFDARSFARSPNAMRNLTPGETNFIKSCFGTRKSLQRRSTKHWQICRGASENFVLLSLEHFVSLDARLDFDVLTREVI